MGSLEMQVRYGYSRREVTGTRIEDKTMREVHEGAITLQGETGEEARSHKKTVKAPGLDWMSRIQGKLVFRVFFLGHRDDRFLAAENSFMARSTAPARSTWRVLR